MAFVVIAACSALAVASAILLPHDVELHELGALVTKDSEEQSNRVASHRRLSLSHLEAMWHTSLGKELDKSSTGREEAFRAALDSEWAFLASLRGNGDDENEDTTIPMSLIPDRNGSRLLEPASSPSTRSSFLVCTYRHPDAIIALQSVVHHTRTRLAYSRGDTSCLLTGLRLSDADVVRGLEGVIAVEPLPHMAKLSRSLHANLDPFDDATGQTVQSDPTADIDRDINAAAANSDPRGGNGGGSSASATRHPEAAKQVQQNKRADAARQDGQQPSLPHPQVRFIHSHRVPGDLDVSLTPGSWGLGTVRRWTQHLTSFGSTKRLWDKHLRERFMWTRSASDVHRATVDGDAPEGNREERHGRRASDAGDSATLSDAYGLTHAAKLWQQVASHSSEDGACDFSRLRTSSEDELHAEGTPNTTDGKPQRHGRKRSSQQPRGGGKRINMDGETHDRVVIRGAGSLGRTEQDNAHCLLTVLAYLTSRKEVAYVDDIPPVIPLNIEAAWITQSGQETKYPLWDQGIDGRTEIIAMADSGLDVNSCFFKEGSGEENIECSSYTSPVYDLTKRKVVQYIAYADCVDNENGHGTHVAGSAAGGISESSPGEHFGDGSGFRAKLAVFDFGNDEGQLVTPSSLGDQMLQPPYDIGARISTNSWGAVRTTYTSLDRQMDHFAYSNTDMVIVIAAGNCGDIVSGCTFLNNPVYGAGSILSPALAKNVIAVGASEASPSSAGLADNVNQVAYFSSQGPLEDDGRIKPDVMAPGYHLFSASAKPEQDESCEIGPMAGTSMATPIVAGCAAMIRQYFVQGWYPTGMPTPSDAFNPSNALIKAMLVASGTAMTSYDGFSESTTLGDPPDGIQGFGRVLLDSALNLHGSVDLYVEDAIDIAHGQVHSYFVDMDDVLSSSYEGDMKVTMVWMEPAAFTSSVAPVFNDLDLKVVGYDGASEITFYPNNLGTKDDTNTVESVTVSDVDAYEWFNVTVTGWSVTTSNLPYYALVVIGGVAGDYSPISATGRSWFVRWEMTVGGVPVAEAATTAFETGLAEAISTVTGDYTSEESTVLVRIGHTPATSDTDVGTEDSSSTVTVEISVDSEADGYAVLTYVIEVVDGSASTGDEGLSAALNEALGSRTTEDCECTGLSPSGYDCSACEEGDPFSTVTSIDTNEGEYDLLSVEGAGRSPVSVFADDDGTDGGSEALWKDIPGGETLRGVLRTDSNAGIAFLVILIVGFTYLGRSLLRRFYKATSSTGPDSAPDISGMMFGGGTDTFAGGRTWGSTGPIVTGRTDPAGMQSVTDRKEQQRNNASRKSSGNSPLSAMMVSSAAQSSRGGAFWRGEEKH